jgi:formylglycine-generating enzyme required for sulfatase activity
MALGMVLVFGACGGGTAGQGGGLVDGAVDLLDGSPMELSGTGLDLVQDGVTPDADQMAPPDQLDAQDTITPDTQDTLTPDTQDTITPDTQDTLNPDTQDTITPDTTPDTIPACTPLSRVCLNDMAFECDQQGQELLLMKDCPAFGDLCVDGQCVPPCIPDCTGKICGDDGCAGSCGTCGGGGSCVEGTRCTYPGTGGVTWVAIPGGTFQMGCSAGDSGCTVYESPVHQVTLTGFEMLETEITEGQYLAVMGSNPSAHFNGASGTTMPVENINWSQAKAFCEAIGGRLPTEAEWEYAARGGTTTKYYCGNDDSCLGGIAWYPVNAGIGKQPVKGKTANAYGLYDMLGNIWEWTNDWYAAYGAGAQTNPQGPDSWYDRVFRGGAFDSGEFFLRVSYRAEGDPSDALDFLGARCARSK